MSEVFEYVPQEPYGTVKDANDRIDKAESAWAEQTSAQYAVYTDDEELVAIGHETGNEKSNNAIERFIDAVGGQYDGVLRNWTPLGDTIADHHRYTVTQDEFRE